MPTRKVATVQPIKVAAGAGITAGLEIWYTSISPMILVDHSTDGRFATDVSTWNAGAAAGLNAKATKKLKDAVTTATAAAQ